MSNSIQMKILEQKEELRRGKEEEKEEIKKRKEEEKLLNKKKEKDSEEEFKKKKVLKNIFTYLLNQAQSHPDYKKNDEKLNRAENICKNYLNNN